MLSIFSIFGDNCLINSLEPLCESCDKISVLIKEAGQPLVWSLLSLNKLRSKMRFLHLPITFQMRTYQPYVQTATNVADSFTSLMQTTLDLSQVERSNVSVSSGLEMRLVLTFMLLTSSSRGHKLGTSVTKTYR